MTTIYVRQKILPLSLSDGSHFQCLKEGSTFKLRRHVYYLECLLMSIK